jgi:hypothetical protein
VVLGIVAHLADVALERIEIEDQAWRLNLILAHSRNSRDIISDLETGEFGFDVHVVVLPKQLVEIDIPAGDDDRPRVMNSRRFIRSPRRQWQEVSANCQAERLGSLQIDHQFKSRRLSA